MGFWSVNPYVGCEFGCTYCYARDTHRYAVERAEQRDGVRADEEVLPPWLAFEKRILVKTDVAERLGSIVRSVGSVAARAARTAGAAAGRDGRGQGPDDDGDDGGVEHISVS